MSGLAIKTIYISGSGYLPWCYAATLKADYGDALSVHVDAVPDEAPQPGLVIEGGCAFHARIGIDDLEVLRRCDALFGLGTRWIGWQGEGSAAMISESAKLPNIGGVALHQILLRAATERQEPERLIDLLYSFQFGAQAALMGKFAHPSNDPQSPRALLHYNLHCDATRYAQLLRGKALELGAIDGAAATHDLHIDCNLASATPGPFTAICSARSNRAVANRPYATASALECGIGWHVPHAAGQSATLLYDAATVSVEDAAKILRSILDDPDADVGRAQSVAPSMQKPAWEASEVSGGPFICALGLLDSLELKLAHRAALRLPGLLPITDGWSLEQGEYHRLLHLDIAQAQDLIALPLQRCQRAEPFWQSVRKSPCPDMLARRIEQFQSRGRIVTFDSELIEEQGWVDRLGGFGIVPDRYDPLADALDMQRTGQMLAKLADAFHQTLAAMPMADEYRAKFLHAMAGQARPDPATQFPAANSWSAQNQRASL